MGTGACYELRDLPLETVVDFSIRGFNASRGTLEAVSILAFVDFHGEARLYNPTPLPIPAYVELRYVGAYGGVDWGPNAVDESPVQALAFQFVSPGEAVTVQFAYHPSEPHIPHAVYAPSFVTPRPVPLTFDTGSLAPIFTNGLEVDITTARVDTARFSFSYQYDPKWVVGPEPSTAVLLSLGAISLLTRRRALKR
jgi:hypothetical protein